MIFKIVLPENDPQQTSYFMDLLGRSGLLPCLRTAEQDNATGRCILTIDAPEQQQQEAIKRIAATVFVGHRIVSI